jgi:hypothetical protein
MSGAAILGLVLYVAVAAAFAGFWHRVWRLGSLPTVAAAACSAAAALAMDYVTTGEMNTFAAPMAAFLFVVALAVGGLVQFATRRSRAKESAFDA